MLPKEEWAKSNATRDAEFMKLDGKASSLIRLPLVKDILFHVSEDETTKNVWSKLQSMYLSKSLTNKLVVKQKLFMLRMNEGTELEAHLNYVKKVIYEMMVDKDFNLKEKDLCLILLYSLPKSYETVVATLLWGRDTIKLEGVTSSLMDYNQRHQAS